MSLEASFVDEPNPTTLGNSEAGTCELLDIDTDTEMFRITCFRLFTGDGPRDGSSLTYVITRPET